MSNHAKWRTFSIEQLQQFVATSRSYRELAGKLGYQRDGGGTIKSLHNMCEELGLDVSHFQGQKWNKENYDIHALYNGAKKKNGKDFLKTVLGIKQLPRQCERCGLSAWMGSEIPLQVHHINGIHQDNRIENLQVLCHNCHAQTDTYCIPYSKRQALVTELEYVSDSKSEF